MGSPHVAWCDIRAKGGETGNYSEKKLNKDAQTFHDPGRGSEVHNNTDN